MRTLALDWGTVRIGAAVSDENGKVAFPLDKPISADNLSEIKRLVEDKQVELIIIGYPLNLAGQETQSVEKVKQFAEKLKGLVAVSIELVDERFSSVSAEKILSEQGMGQKEQRLMKDNIAAQMMLQQYLDTK